MIAAWFRCAELRVRIRVGRKVPSNGTATKAATLVALGSITLKSFHGYMPFAPETLSYCRGCAGAYDRRVLPLRKLCQKAKDSIIANALDVLGEWLLESRHQVHIISNRHLHRVKVGKLCVDGMLEAIKIVE